MSPPVLMCRAKESEDLAADKIDGIVSRKRVAPREVTQLSSRCQPSVRDDLLK